MITYKDYLQTINKETLYQKYEIENYTLQQTADYFGISLAILIRLLRYYDIHKSKDAHVQNIKKSKKEKYGTETYNNPQKRAQTCLDKYGADNIFKTSAFIEQAQIIKKDRYGTCNNIDKNLATRIKNSGSLQESYQHQFEKYRETCRARYGVDNASLSPQVKSAIKNSVKKTFLEKYGVDNYWGLDNAKRSNGSKNSKPNLVFKQMLDENNISYEQEFSLDGKWYDFKVNEFLIEINPSPTHNLDWSPFSDNGIKKEYHLEKSQIAEKHHFKCIHIWDWDDPEKIINQFLLPRARIYARKCEVREVSFQDTVAFLNKHHLQGYARDTVRLGLYYNNTLISIMTFGKPRYNRTVEYELIRYCSYYDVIGGSKKLFSYFIKNYNPRSIISYCDRSKFLGELYITLGFKQTHKLYPSIHWYNCKTHKHITDNLLRKLGYDKLFNTNFGKDTSNEILMLQNGFCRISDCGQAAYIWRQDP